MPRIIKTFSIPAEALPIYEEFRLLLLKDKRVVISGKEYSAKNVSEAFLEFMKLYVQVHSNNPAPALTKWVADSDFVAFPTLGEAPKLETIKKMDDTMLKRLKSVAQSYAYMADKEVMSRGLV